MFRIANSCFRGGGGYTPSYVIIGEGGWGVKYIERKATSRRLQGAAEDFLLTKIGVAIRFRGVLAPSYQRGLPIDCLGGG